MPLSFCEFRKTRRSEHHILWLSGFLSLFASLKSVLCDVSAFNTVQHCVKVGVDDATLFLSSLAACRLQTEERIGKICTLRQGVRNLSCFCSRLLCSLPLLPYALLLSAPCAWRRLGTLFHAVAITRSESNLVLQSAFLRLWQADRHFNFPSSRYDNDHHTSPLSSPFVLCR